MSNIIDSIQLSGVTYAIQGSGGGKAIEAGRGISITTGETADTVSFNLPISAGTGTNSVIEGSTSNFARGNYAHAEGSNTKASGQYSHAEGYLSEARGEGSHAEGTSTSTKYYSHGEGCATFAVGNYSHAEGEGTTAATESSHAEGRYTITKNNAEHASGQFNNSVTASTTFGDSGNTLFSVGNGTSNSARHNAFEIRQNGDIYLSSGGTDIKLQDHLGGGGGNPTVELTQAEYDALVTAGTVSPTTYYIITDATPADLSQYWTSAQTNSAITSAVSTKQDTLVSGTNIKTINNESILGSGNIDIQGGGGKAIVAGRGISVTTGETADTVSFNLPISAGTGTNSIKCGETSQASGTDSFAIGSNGVKASGLCSFAGGSYSEARGMFSMAFGRYSITNNYGEVALGFFGKSNGSSNAPSQSSGNTLFSLGNGTNGYSGKHNAFEVRQNGDIYITLNDQDVKLQDQLGGSSITVDTALDSGSTNPVENRVIYNKIDEVEQVTARALNNINDRLSEDEEVTAAGLNALNDAFGGLKLMKISQTDYNNLQVKDPSTLYIIVN